MTVKMKQEKELLKHILEDEDVLAKSLLYKLISEKINEKIEVIRKDVASQIIIK